jgi:ubiquitin C-terminal hydrolase
MAHQPKKHEWNIHRLRSAKTAAKKTLQGKLSEFQTCLARRICSFTASMISIAFSIQHGTLKEVVIWVSKTEMEILLQKKHVLAK